MKILESIERHRSCGFIARLHGGNEAHQSHFFTILVLVLVLVDLVAVVFLVRFNEPFKDRSGLGCGALLPLFLFF
jgi:hypothetical protein